MQRGKKCGIIQKDHPETNVSRWFSGIEVTGLEPAASWSQTTRATNCATPRSYNLLIIIHKRRGRQALAQQKSGPVVFIFQVLGKGDGLLVGKNGFPGGKFPLCKLFQIFPQCGQQGVHADGFGDVVIHAGVKRALLIFFKGVGRHGDDGHGGPGIRQSTDGLRCLVAVHAGHLDIHEHGVVVPGGFCPKSFQAAVHRPQCGPR